MFSWWTRWSFFFFPFFLFGSQVPNGSIVKIFSTVKDYDYFRPWTSPDTARVTGSGFIIEGNQIITNAHVIANAASIKVHTPGNRRKFEAKVKMIGHDCDLALLEVSDLSFFEGKEPLPFSSEMPYQEQSIQVYGFPVGGSELSITRGIVSRVELSRYVYSGATLLISQVDAPINAGNSGGPVISNGVVVGIAHQGSNSGQNIGYMIPIPVVQHFLQEKDSEYQGFPSALLTHQEMENEGIRQYYGMGKEENGILIREVCDTHFLYGLLEQGDILLAIDGFEIDALGLVFIEEMNRSLPFSFLIMMKHFGDPITLTILRSGEQIEVQGIVDRMKKGTELVPYDTFERKPTYYIYGGCVFQPLSGNLIRHFPPQVDFYHLSLRGRVTRERDEVVVLTSILDDQVNAGYQDLEIKVIDRVNGKNVANLRDMIKIIEACKDPFVVIKTIDETEIILNREEVEERGEMILKDYSIEQDRSEDLR